MEKMANSNNLKLGIEVQSPNILLLCNDNLTGTLGTSTVCRGGQACCCFRRLRETCANMLAKLTSLAFKLQSEHQRSTKTGSMSFYVDLIN